MDDAVKYPEDCCFLHPLR